MNKIEQYKKAVELLRELCKDDAFVYNIIKSTIKYLEQRIKYLEIAERIFDKKVNA